MKPLVVAVILATNARAARAEPDLSFVSAGISISVGSRGWAFGVEVSGGIPLPVVEEPAYLGTAIGIDFAPSSRTWGRVYLEVEGGAVIAGMGLGPTWLFGGPEPGGHFQITPYLSMGDVGCGTSEPYLTFAPYYRYTSRRTHDGLHEVGTFVKGLVFPNGHEDGGLLCFH